jgi:hypothetical protein
MLYSGIESMTGYGQRTCFIPGSRLGPAQFFCWWRGREKGRKGEVGNSVKEIKERDRRTETVGGFIHREIRSWVK